MRKVASSQLPVARNQQSLATGYWLLATLLILLAPTAFGCPVCYGNPDEPMVQATNRGIWVLLGFVAFVQIGFAALFIAFWRRARAQKRFRDSFHVIEGGPHP